MLLGKAEALRFIKHTIRLADESRVVCREDFQPGDQVVVNIPVIVMNAKGELKVVIQSYKTDKFRRDMRKDTVNYYQNAGVMPDPSIKVQAKACAVIFHEIYKALWDVDVKNTKNYNSDDVVLVVLKSPKVQKLVDVGKRPTQKISSINVARSDSDGKVNVGVINKQGTQSVMKDKSESKQLMVYKSVAIAFAKNLLTILEKVDLRIPQAVAIPVILDNPNKRGSGADLNVIGSDTITIMNVLRNVYSVQDVYKSAEASVRANGYNMSVEWSSKLFNYVVKEWMKIGQNVKSRPSPGLYAEKIITQGIKTLGLRELGDGKSTVSKEVSKETVSKEISHNKPVKRYACNIRFIGRQLGKNDPFGGSSEGIEATDLLDAERAIRKRLKAQYPKMNLDRYRIEIRESQF